MSERNGDGTVAKALDVLDHVVAARAPLRFTDLLQQTSYPRATLFRFLKTLMQQGMVEVDDSGAYGPGPRLYRLARTVQNGGRGALDRLARPMLDRLAEETGETIHLARLDGPHVLYLDRREAHRPVEMFSRSGRVGPAYCTGIGKAMLSALPAAQLASLLPHMAFHAFTPTTLTSADALSADLAAARSRGYALDREEHEPGIICVAVPITTGTSQLLGGLSLTSTTARTTPEALAAYAPRLAAAAAAIASAAEGRAPMA